MKVAVVHSFYNRYTPSGENSAVVDQVEALARAGHEVHLVHIDSPSQPPLAYSLAAAVRVGSGRGRNPLEEIRVLSPDVLHIHNLFPNWGYRWLLDNPYPAVWTMHNYRLLCAAANLTRDGSECTLCPERGSWNALTHRCYRNSALATAPLAFETRRRRRTHPLVDNTKMQLVLNDTAEKVLCARFPQAEVRIVPNFAADSGHPPTKGEQRRGWLFAGRLSAEKGASWLARHWPSGEPLTIVGDGPLAGEVAAIASSRSEVLLTGPLTRSQLRELMAQSLGLVIPSLCAEGLPTVILEALSVGTPILVSQRVSACQRLVASKAAAAFSVIDQGESLRRARQQVAQEWDSFHRDAVQLFTKEYCEERWANHVEQIYLEAIG